MIELKPLELKDYLVGAGGVVGKGGSGGGVEEDPNTLRSRSFLNIVYLLSKGEIAGWAAGEDPRRNIYIDDVPVMSPAPSTEINVKGVSYQWRSGTPGQTVMLGSMGFGAANYNAVDQKVSIAQGAITRLINDLGASAVRVALYTPLLRSSLNNRVSGSSVRFKIEISTNGGPWVEKKRDELQGKTSGGYARDYTIQLTSNGPWQIRLTRLDPDSNTDQVSNDLYWQGYTTQFADQYSYPGNALLYLRFDSAYLKSNNPKITIRIRGIICSVPSNYDPVARTYTGIWNGLFGRAATANPAWALYTSLLADWGMGDRIKEYHVDKLSFYRFAQYCDERISDGWGGTECRHSFRRYWRTREDALPALNDFLIEARAQLYWDGGKIFLVHDRPGSVLSDIFTNADVETKYDKRGVMTQPSFHYSYSSTQAIHTVALITFYNEQDFGRKEIIRVDSADVGYAADLTTYGEVPIEKVLPGCTTRAGATRYGRWVLITERLEDKMVDFIANNGGQLRRPGELIDIQDNNEAGVAVGGRILASTLSSVTLDRPVTWAIGDRFILDTPALVTITATNAGTNSTVVGFTALTEAPLIGSVWIVVSATKETYRILSVGEKEAGKFPVQGVLHDSSKYAIADNLTNFTTSSYGVSSVPEPAPPTNMVVRPTDATSAGFNPNAIANNYEIGWAPSPTGSVTGYVLQKTTNSANYWEAIPVPPGYTDVKLLVDASQYIFRVAAIGISGKLSSWLYGFYGDQRQGTIVGYTNKGGLRLSRSVVLLANTTYQLESVLNGAVVRQTITNTNGVTDEITTTPGWLGLSATYIANTPNLGVMNEKASYFVVSGGSVTFYRSPNYAGVQQILAPGVYRADGRTNSPYRSDGSVYNDFFQSVRVPAGAEVFISEREPGYNAPINSIWRLIQV